MAIKIRNLSYIYSKSTPYEKKALDNVSFDIEEGDFCCIIGHTGSGKSTLLQHFNGLIKLQSGELTVLNYNLNAKKPDYKGLRFAVGMVFQYPEYQLFDDTVNKDVGFGPRNMKLSLEEIEKRVRSSLFSVGLNPDEIGDKSPFEISGGQKRRVAIAGVIAMQPKILVLDEPTAGLDPKGKQEIMNLVLDLKRKLTPTIVMVTHDMDLVAKYATKVCVLKNGKVAFYGNPETLFNDSELVSECSLNLPSGVVLASELRKVGFDIDKNVIKLEEVVDEVARYFPKGGVDNA